MPGRRSSNFEDDQVVYSPTSLPTDGAPDGGVPANVAYEAYSFQGGSAGSMPPPPPAIGGIGVTSSHGFRSQATDTATEDNGPEKVYQILEDAIPRPDHQGLEIPQDEAQRRREATEQAWDRIRRWLWAHESQEDRAAAAYVRGQADTTVLHLIFRLSNPPTDVVLDLVSAAPEVVSWTDSHGWLPIHHAAAYGSPTDVLKIICDAYPEGKTAQDNQQRTPLHFFSTRKLDNPSVSIANVTLLCQDSRATELTDTIGMLPMHYACAYGQPPEVLQVMADANSASLKALDDRGRTPMHLAMVNAHREASPGVIKFLLSGKGKETINMRDLENNLPIHLLSIGLKGSKGSKSETQEKMNNVSQCLKMYLAAEPHASPDFLTALQELHEDLQDVAVVSSHVRNILNTKIVQRFPTMILMLDGYWLITLIVCFEVTTTAQIDRRVGGVDTDERTGALVFLFLGCIYFLARELVQMLSLWNLGGLRRWFFDPTNWLDMAVVVMVGYYAIIMAGDIPYRGPDEFKSGIAFTKMVLWMAAISFLKKTLVDFAVFVGGVFYVVQRLVAFLLAVGVILLAFAQMFFIVYSQRDVCTQNPANDQEFEAEFGFAPCAFPHCSFIDSLLQVYSMMMGEIGAESRYDNVLVAQILYFFYAFLVVILLSNVLIAIVTDSYEIIQNDRAGITFWTNRLDFIAEMDVIRSVGKNRFGFGPKSKNKRASGAPTSVQEGPNGTTTVSMADDIPNNASTFDSKDYFREGWKQILELFSSNFYDYVDLNPRNIEFWCYLLYQGFAVFFIIPLWLTAGLLTAGWLWPPQVREYLFVQKETVVSRAELERQKLDQLKEIQSDINRLKVDIRREMSSDREDLLRMKTEVEIIQSEVLADLQQVKELMTTLLDLGGLAEDQ